MPVVTERARAKINLTLTVLGRRPDGNHELLSLVAFADAADEVSLDPSAPAGLTVTGPFASAIEGPNLVETALRLLSDRAPGLAVGHVSLAKHLPVASGVGGGSSDAAAVLRAVRTAHPQATADLDWAGIASGLGADVPVCLENRATWMAGAGEDLRPLSAPLPRLDAVLVNPQASVPPDKTARVFRALGAPPLATSGGLSASALPDIPTRAELLALIERTGNDLEPPAVAIVPEIDEVLSVLEATPGALLARLSGAGPTCFAVFPNAAAARSAAAELKAAHPAWWIAPVVLE